MTYEKEALRTVSDSFYGELRSIRCLEGDLMEVIKVCRRLDELKGAVFYGKGKDGLIKLPESLSVAGGHKTEKERHILHAILLIITEASELVEWFLDDKPLSNAIEEIGDIEWSINYLCHTLGVKQEQAREINLKKLKSRFPDKFTEDNAINRDLEAEEVVLSITETF